MPVLGFAIEDEIEYNGCGIMKTDEPWKHLPRVFDLWVLALCTKGTMYMNIEGSEFAIRPGDVFILPVRRLHYGTRDSEGGISYYWAHFEAPDLDCLLERECVDARKIAAWPVLPDVSRLAAGPEYGFHALQPALHQQLRPALYA